MLLESGNLLRVKSDVTVTMNIKGDTKSCCLRTGDTVMFVSCEAVNSMHLKNINEIHINFLFGTSALYVWSFYIKDKSIEEIMATRSDSLANVFEKI